MNYNNGTNSIDPGNDFHERSGENMNSLEESIEAERVNNSMPLSEFESSSSD